MIVIIVASILMIAVIVYSIILSNNDKYNERLWNECIQKSTSKEYKTMECVSRDREGPLIFFEIEDMESLNRLDYDFMIDDKKKEIKLFPLG